MSLIKDRKSNSSGAYQRVIGNKKLDALISRTHATTIASGAALEKLVADKSTAFIIKNDLSLKEVLDNKKIDNNRYYLIPKDIIKKSKIFSCKISPDFIIIDSDKKELLIVELKEGHVFDTKKSSSELNSLKKFREFISPHISYKTNFFICSFHSNDKSEVFNGLKRKFPLEHIMISNDFCELLGIDYDEIMDIKNKEKIINFNYFVDELMAIPEVKNRALTAIKDYENKLIKTENKK